jgi:hypothetical protein
MGHNLTSWARFPDDGLVLHSSSPLRFQPSMLTETEEQVKDGSDDPVINGATNHENGIRCKRV